MSATLGQGGDLERITGRRAIRRIPIPPTWEKRGLGRRLFLFPSRAVTEEKEAKLLPSLIRRTPRTTILVPSTKRADQWSKLLETTLRTKIFTAREIQSSKAPFVSSSNAAAILANRYDGIDFPDDDCRLLIVDGMPKSVNLQERFLIARMNASAILNDRVMTRIVQAFGRCTRSATDYSAVIVVGEEILNLLMRPEKRSLLHPELQAEIYFGLEQSKTDSEDDFGRYLDHFLAQDDEWRSAEEVIQSLRDEQRQEPMLGTEELQAGVRFEIAYQDAMWNADYERALAEARRVIDQLKDPKLAGYRCLWNYLAGSAAYLATLIDGRQLTDLAKDFFYGASKETTGITWLNQLARYTDNPEERVSVRHRDAPLLERFEAFLEDIGSASDNRLVRVEKSVREGLASSAKGPFEAAHVQLGQMLGYDAGNKETSGAPDPWWIVDEDLCLIFEDHADARSPSLDVSKARQAATHPNWARENLRELYTCLTQLYRWGKIASH